MDAITPTLIAVGCINLLMFPVLVHIITRRMDKYDEKRELARLESESAREESRLWRQAMTSGMKSLLRAEIIHEHDKWTRRGHCPLESKGYLTRLHESYKNVGGNSIGDKLYEETMALPTNDGEDIG